MGDLEISHDILIAGSDLKSCVQHVKRFFAATMLIRYDQVMISEKESLNGTAEKFRGRIEAGLRDQSKGIGRIPGKLKGGGF